MNKFVVLAAAASIALGACSEGPFSDRVSPSNSPVATPASPSGGAAPRGLSGSGTSMIDDTMAFEMLRQQGYTSVSDLKREGNVYTAIATRNGVQQTVRIDARSGRVMQ